MVALPRLRRLSESLLSLGEYPGETDIRRGKRRIVIGYVVFGSLARFIGSAVEFSDGLAGVEFPSLVRHWSVKVAASSTSRASSLWVFNSEGHREILGLDPATTEHGAGWLAFLRSLVARGLSGTQLVISDDHTGLVDAIEITMAGASWQQCRTHYLANLLTKVPKSSGSMVATMGAHHICSTRPGPGVGPAPPCRRPTSPKLDSLMVPITLIRP